MRGVTVRMTPVAWYWMALTTGAPGAITEVAVWVMVGNEIANLEPRSLFVDDEQFGRRNDLYVGDVLERLHRELLLTQHAHDGEPGKVRPRVFPERAGRW